MDLSSIKDCLEIHPKTGFVSSINHRAVASWLLERIPIATVVETGEMLVYYSGRYEPHGKQVAHRFLVEALSPFIKETGQTCFSKHVFEETMSIVKGLTYVHIAKFDQDLDIINVKNGLLNWRTMELEPHRPTYYSRIQIPVKYDPSATCPNILKMYKTVLKPDDLEKAFEFVAYCLYRSYPIQKAFILLGKGSTGKSHFIDTILDLVGPANSCSVSMHDLERDRFATSDLYNKLINAFGDMEQTELPNANIMKMLTSNADPIRAQRKNEHAFDFVNFAKLLFATNKLAKVRDDTSGFYRRVDILMFEHVFTPEDNDRELLLAVRTKPELSGLLNIVLPYLGPLLDRGAFTNSWNAETMQDKYKVASSPVSMFIEGHIRECADAFVSKDAVYHEYCKFCEVHGVEKLHPVWFGRNYKRLVSWNHDGVREFGSVKKTAWLNTQLIPIGI